LLLTINPQSPCVTACNTFAFHYDTNSVRPSAFQSWDQTYGIRPYITVYCVTLSQLSGL